MSPHSPSCTAVRPAAVVNEAIRAVAWRARGREWKQAERDLYRLLVEEWVAAEQAELTTAA